MKYLIMECHLSYAVALDNEGRFIKIANMGYEVGQEVYDVIIVKENKNSKNLNKKYIYSTVAACFILVLIFSVNVFATVFGTVRMTINPDVILKVNRFNYVLNIEGVNTDGNDLISGYKYFGKKVDVVADELADKAIDMGYLKDSGKIALTVDSKNTGWKTTTEDLVIFELNSHLDNKINVKIGPPEELDDYFEIYDDDDDDDDDD